MTPVETTYTIRGTMQGELWWEGPAQKPVEQRFYRTGARAVPFAWAVSDLVEMADMVGTHEGGDFRNAGRLTADSELVIERADAIGGRLARRVLRSFPMTMFPSIAEYVDADAFTYWPEDEA